MEQGWKPKHNPWLIALVVSMATFMEVLDTSVANVSLPHIAGDLGAGLDESTWVLTSYLVANAVVLPISAYLSNLIGRKRYYMLCVALFGFSSLLCGLAPNLPLLLFFRVLQGVGGGGLAPSENAILVDTFEPKMRGGAFALYGFAVVMAPTLGPTLGGWITEAISWRWIFFINIPVVLLSLFLTNRVVEDPPHVKEAVERSRRGKFHLDFLGFGLVLTGFGFLQVVLDKGQIDDWFGSPFITAASVVSGTALALLIWWELRLSSRQHRPILDLKLFTNSTFALCFVMMFVLGFVLFAGNVLLPQLMQTLMGYTASLAGLAMSSGGVASIVTLPIVGYAVAKADGRYLIGLGFLITAIGLHSLEGLTLQISFGYAATLRFYQSLGLGLLFVPINTQAFTGTTPAQSNDVSGLTNLARMVGGSVGTSFVATELARRSQFHQERIVSNFVRGSRSIDVYLSNYTRFMGSGGGSNQALAKLYQETIRQSQLLSYLDMIHMLSIACLAMVPFVFLMKRKEPEAGTGGVH